MLSVSTSLQFRTEQLVMPFPSAFLRAILEALRHPPANVSTRKPQLKRWKDGVSIIGLLRGGGVPRGGGSLIFPKVPQSSLGFNNSIGTLQFNSNDGLRVPNGSTGRVLRV